LIFHVFNDPSFRCRNVRQPIDNKGNPSAATVAPRQRYSSKLVKTIVKNRQKPEKCVCLCLVAETDLFRHTRADIPARAAEAGSTLTLTMSKSHLFACIPRKASNQGYFSFHPVRLRSDSGSSAGAGARAHPSIADRLPFATDVPRVGDTESGKPLFRLG
jgi:hypothetical protein